MEESTKMCKVCHHGDSPENPLCYPCRCKGTIKYIHKDCLFLFIESSGKSFCTICKHNYQFIDIFKPETPERVPLRLILKGVYERLRDIGLRIISNVLTLGMFFVIFLVNGLLMFTSSGFPLREALSVSGVHIVFLLGCLTTIISYINYHLYFNLANYIRQIENRRTLRIDPLSAMNSIATDVLTSTDVETDTHARTILSNITLSLSNQMNEEIDAIAILDDNESNTATASSEEDVVIVSSETRRIFSNAFGFTLLFKCINISVFWWFITLLSNSINLNYNIKFAFLREIYLYDLTKRFFILYFVILGLVGVTRVLYKNFKMNALKIVYSFSKIYHMIFLSLMHFVYFQGVGVHYIFSDLINGGKAVLDLKFSFFSRYKTLLSLFFHFTIGYFVTHMAKRSLKLFKNRFRKGMLYFIADPPSNDLAFVYNVSHEQVFGTILRDIIYGCSTLVLARYVLFILRGSMSNGYYTFSIRSVNKLLLLFKIIDLVSSSFSFYHSLISGFVNLVVRWLAYLLDLSNYLYGDVVKVDKTDLKLFKWLPNRHKYYRVASVRRNYKKNVTQDDIERYFNKQNDKNFSVFYIPHLFRYKIMLVTFVALTTYVCFYLMLFRLSNHVASYFNAERFFDNSSDIVLIVISGLILQLLRISIYLAGSAVEMKCITNDILRHVKQTIVLLFSILVWPLWSAFIVLILYSESLSSIYPGRLVSLFFSSSSIISFILNRVIFTRSIADYSFSRIFRKLYGFISAMTFIIICISLLRSYSFLVMIDSSEIPFLLIFGISASLFYLKHCIRNAFSSFLEGIKKEHYLLDRNVENYVPDQVD